ncbi:MAG: SusD/RagB family nutrient-binding outer membrane lipoprotein [Bacteroidetes bacterium]|nr:SusD/RagB family nutrient-binding outer membrane lipoprotein [Bacteroidota bacterium]MBU1113736.1 SusD/RagB family nutrient-binding outer membrane lipoprotein [Bacteroidota bacterium]MBU1799364.1 SusD/RagB family nutrient-binding outer membrane lipoprotein [Bacteroidota bacterium]
MKKNKNTKKIILILATLYSLLFISCSDFINDPDIQNDPNRATKVSPDLLFNAVQVRQFSRYEGHTSRTAAIWTQQLAGVDRQAISLGIYDITESEWRTDMDGLYTGGGLVDIRKILKETEAKGWKTYSGIAKVWEALSVGMSASLWGDLPYSEAVSETSTPKLDKQEDIYTAIQALLDQAIINLTEGGGYLPPNDFVYSANSSKWIEAANSLKARFYLHWAEVDPVNYTRALSAIQKGLSSNANNFKTYHTTVENESSTIYQYWRTRNSDIRAGKFLVDLLISKNDPRLEKYFQEGVGSVAGQFIGVEPGGTLTDASNLSETTKNPDNAFEIMTFTEANLIWAECAFKTGDESTALAKLNEARRAEENRWGLPADTLGTAVGLNGDALINTIMQEKYIALFMNVEIYNDWKRTNRPFVTPYSGGQIPRRLLYSSNERASNPFILAPSLQPLRNNNDPNDNY